MNRLILATSLLLALAACGSDTSQSSIDTVTPTTETELDPVKGINWFEGSVDEAFAAAEESGKPIYLYWGAVWCPPCHAIAATVFKSPEFIERSKLFIPVYLDGDTENAQAYGEKFGVLGYPTMIVFDSSGKELTRIPGGIDLQAYANILDLTLDQASPVAELVDSLMSGTTELDAPECTLLAYYSWGQDRQILAESDSMEAFQRMHAACPADLEAERSILYLSWLDEAIEASEDTEEPRPLSDTQKNEALAVIATVLADDDLIKANIFHVLFSGADYAAALTAAGSTERTEFTEAFLDALDRVAADESVYKRERIYTLAGRINFERIDDAEAELSSELQQQIRDMVAWADETTPSVYERQPIINALGNILHEAGMDDVAKPLLLAELDRSKQPYYFMVDIADIEQRAGNIDEAIDWLKKAHESASGPATRFQWGYYYLAGLLEMVPEDAQLIHDTTVGLIDELQNSTGLYQRPKAQLGRLESRLIAWGEENDQASALADIRESVLAICAAAARQDEARSTCESFLESV